MVVVVAEAEAEAAEDVGAVSRTTATATGTTDGNLLVPRRLRDRGSSRAPLVLFCCITY